MWFPTRQQHSAQSSFMLEKFLKSLENSGVGGMLLTDLSKAFGCLRHDLLIAQLAIYGFH